MLASRRNKNNIKLLKTDKGEILTEQTQILNEFQKWYGKTSKEDLSDETTPEKIADIQSSYIKKNIYMYLLEIHLTIMKTYLKDC